MINVLFSLFKNNLQQGTYLSHLFTVYGDYDLFNRGAKGWVIFLTQHGQVGQPWDVERSRHSIKYGAQTPDIAAEGDAGVAEEHFRLNVSVHITALLCMVFLSEGLGGKSDFVEVFRQT